jgi:hypothetical protein
MPSEKPAAVDSSSSEPREVRSGLIPAPARRKNGSRRTFGPGWWGLGYTPRACQQRKAFTPIVRELLDNFLDAARLAPWRFGVPNVHDEIFVAPFGWYGRVIYSISPEHHAIVVLDCRWRPPRGHAGTVLREAS